LAFHTLKTKIHAWVHCNCCPKYACTKWKSIVPVQCQEYQPTPVFRGPAVGLEADVPGTWGVFVRLRNRWTPLQAGIKCQC